MKKSLFVVNGLTFEISVFGACGLGGDYGQADLFSFSDHKGRLAHGPSGLGVTERAAPQILSLPIYPRLSDEALDRVIVEISDFSR